MPLVGGMLLGRLAHAAASGWGAAAAAAGAALPHARALSAAAAGAPRQPVPRARLAGQPTPATHPELLRPDELTLGVTAAEYRQRRRRLAQALPDGAVAVVPAASTAYVTGVIPYPYRQDADFAYLTGMQQHAVALIHSSSTEDGDGSGGGGGGGGPRFVLFIPPADRERERWDGAWLGPQAAKEVFGADEVHLLHELAPRLSEVAADAPAVLFDLDRPSGFQYSHVRAALQGAGARARVQALRPLMHRLRWRKSAAELRLMRASALAAGAAVRRCIGISRPGVHEAELAATFEYECKLAGAPRNAYPPVVAGGPDAVTIHYSRNDKRVAGGEMVLMDAGCEYGGYASDVTRTWPVSGSFSGAQRDVYDVVLDARRRVLEAVRPGATLGRLHQLSVRLLSEGLQQLRVLPGLSADAIQAQHYREFYCHSIGHYLGLDVHDTNTVGSQIALEPSVVMAIEPGLYIPDHPRFGPFAGIGVRIEDDVLVTSQGAQVLSDNVPVEAADIEALVGAALEESSSAAAAAGGGGAARRAAAAA
ncbi:MAG: peptidase M24, structural domain-containing protein [Monoraphidium minutum]|nr:MAG: peptidase M24, structural domain-containing protein [Monoraphidium minutum]